MTFGLLGPLRVSDDGRDARVSAPQQRMLLSALLLAGPGRVAAFEDLSEVPWERRPSRGVCGALHSAVQGLRVTLGAADSTWCRPGPRATWSMSPRKTSTCAASRFSWPRANQPGQQKRWTQATALLTQALGLWRGEPMADVPSRTSSLSTRTG